MGYTISIPVHSKSKVLTFLEKEFRQASEIFEKIGIDLTKGGWYDGANSYAPKRKDLVAINFSALFDEEEIYIRALAHWLAMKFGKTYEFDGNPMHFYYHDKDRFPIPLTSDIGSDRFEYKDSWTWTLSDDGIPMWDPIRVLTPLGKKPSFYLRMVYRKRRINKVNKAIRAELARLNKVWYAFK